MTVSKNVEVLPPAVAIEQRFKELNLGELGLSSSFLILWQWQLKT